MIRAVYDANVWASGFAARNALTADKVSMNTSAVKTPELSGRPGNIARAFQDAVIDTLVEKTARAVRQFGRGRVVLGGGVAGTAGVYLVTALAPPGLYRGGAALQCMRPGATPLCRSCRGAGYSQWHRPDAAPRPDTRPAIPLADQASRLPRAGTLCRSAVNVRVGWLLLHLHHTRTQTPCCSGAPNATVARGLRGAC